jgi:hypothetical protein
MPHQSSNHPWRCYASVYNARKVKELREARERSARKYALKKKSIAEPLQSLSVSDAAKDMAPRS